MNHSENISELAIALSKAQGEMQAAIKNCENKFLKNQYADLASVWDACRGNLSKHGLCVTQFTDNHNDKLCLVTMLCHTSGQWIKSIMPLYPKNMDSQGIGAAITYMRRYGLSAICGVVTDKEIDDDGETAMGRGQCDQEKKTKNIMNEFYKKIAQVDKECKENFDNHIFATFKTKIYEHLPESFFPIAMRGFNNNIEKNKKASNEISEKQKP